MTNIFSLSIKTFFLNLGIFFAQLLTTELVFGRSITEEETRSGRLPSWRWQWALASNAVPLLISWPILFFSVESPRFLFLERGDENAARKGAYCANAQVVLSHSQS